MQSGVNEYLHQHHYTRVRIAVSSRGGQSPMIRSAKNSGPNFEVFAAHGSQIGYLYMSREREVKCKVSSGESLDT